MTGVKKIISYRTSDDEIFPTLPEAKFHEDEIAVEQAMNSDSDFQKNMHKAFYEVIFTIYTRIKFNKPTTQIHLNLFELESIIGKPLVDSQHLTAYGDRLRKLLANFGIILMAIPSTQPKLGARGLRVKPADDKSDYNINNLNSLIKDFTTQTLI